MRLDNFYVVGVSHKTLEIEGREEFMKKGLSNMGESLFLDKKIRGHVSLSTCLREELYLHKYEDDEIFELISDLKDSDHIYIYKGMEALKHLFKVVCGLESVIKGEDQILAQVKKSYSQSVEDKRTSKILNIIFHKAIELGKKFRSKSKIAENALSLEAISVKFIKEKVKTFENKKMFILGVGDLATGILNIVQNSGLEKITIANRTRSRAEEVAKIYGNPIVINFEDRYKEIEEADIIISVTSAPNPIIVENELKNRDIGYKNEKIFLDLAVPRDIDLKISAITNVNLYNIDAIWEVYKENMKNRERAGTDYLYLIEKQIQILLKWFEYKEELEKVC